MGPVGRGQVTKAINNLLLWLNGVGLLESAQIAESYDMDLSISETFYCSQADEVPRWRTGRR